MQITFHRADIVYRPKHVTALKAFISKTFKKVTGRELLLRVILCSDDYLLQINRNYLQHDFYTDIITFPLAKNAKSEEAEIYISIDRVKENAKTLNVSATNEFYRVLFHGVLHLTGQKDKTVRDQQQMHAKEDEWIKAYYKYLQKIENQKIM